MIIPLYIADSGEFLSLENRLAFIMVRSGQDLRYFFLTVTIKVNRQNFIHLQKLLRNIFSGTSFKKHQHLLVEQRPRQEKSTLSSTYSPPPIVLKS